MADFAEHLHEVWVDGDPEQLDDFNDDTLMLVRAISEGTFKEAKGLLKELA